MSARPDSRSVGPARPAVLGRGAATRGFTLIEVLVALTIVSVALMASLRAAGTLAIGSVELRARMLAQWSAENRLAQMRIQSEWPGLGSRSFDCTQGSVPLMCTEAVFSTPNTSFRRVEISVSAEGGERRLVRLVGFVTSAQ